MSHPRFSSLRLLGRRPCRSAWCWLALVGWVLCCAPAWARSPRPNSAADKAEAAQSPSVRAAQLVSEGVLALASRDFVAARRALSDAYRLQPSADTLFQLGIVAWSEGQSLVAQDLLRRYLADASASASAEKRSEAQRIVDSIGPERSEVWVQGSVADWVYVDDRLRGQLPLSLPLLLSPGAHRLTLESATGDRRTVDLALANDQSTVVRSRPSGLESAPLARVFLHVASAPDGGRSDALQRRIAGLLIAHDLAEKTVSSGPSAPRSCDVACCLQHGKEQAAEWAIAVQPAQVVDGKETPGQITIVDVAVKDPVAQAAFSAAASAAPDDTELASVLAKLVQAARDRGRGELRVTSVPVGAEVRSGTQLLGQTPLRIQRFSGPLELHITRPGFVSEHRPVVVQRGQISEVNATLQAVPSVTSDAPVAPARAPRPAWRVGLGIGAIAVGVGLVALGASALTVSGRCIDAVEPPVAACPRFFDTTAIGGVLIGSGAAFGVAGGLLLAWPGKTLPPTARKGG